MTDQPSIVLGELDPERHAILRARFDSFDFNNEGKLSFRTLAQAIDRDAPFLDRLLLTVLIRTFDQDHDSHISFDEFVTFSNVVEIANPIALLMKIFDIADVNGDEKLSVSEVQAIAEQMGENFTAAQAQRQLHALDLNGDNFIDRGEFMQLLGR
jgi:Ca2+-binding EF-hand superfamily protein